MTRSGRCATLLFFCIVSGVLGGCGGSGSILVTGSLSGKVTYDGQPVDSGWVNLVPSDGNGPTQAGQIKNGLYDIQGILPGKKNLSVQSGAESQVYNDPGVPKVAGPKTFIPPDALGKNQEVEITGEAKTLDLALTKPPASATPPKR